MPDGPPIGARIVLYVLGNGAINGYVKSADDEAICVSPSKERVGYRYLRSEIWSWRILEEPTE